MSEEIEQSNEESWKSWFNEINDGQLKQNQPTKENQNSNSKKEDFFLFSAAKDIDSPLNMEYNIKFTDDDWNTVLSYLNNYETMTALNLLGSKYIKANVISRDSRVSHIFVEKQVVGLSDNNCGATKKGISIIVLEEENFVFVAGYLENEQKWDVLDYLSKYV